MSEFGGRTDAEREAARREREARRAAQASTPPPEPAPPPPFIDSLEPVLDTEPEPAPPPRRPSGRPATRAARRAPHSYRARLGALLAFALVIGVLFFVVELWQPFHGKAGAPVAVTIPANLSSSAVGDLLERDGVISSSFFFELRATLAGKRSDLHPGTYDLHRGMTYSAVLDVLTKPPPAVRYTNLTISEGRTRRQIAALLRAQGIRGNYLAATIRSPKFDRRRYGAPHGTPTLEGFLFPSTYNVREPITVTALVDDQLREFRRLFATVDLRYAHSKHLTAYDVLAIASIVEAEAATAHDRPLVASVIYNRLKDQMPLGMDSTTRYAVGNYTTPLTAAQLASPSPYNTRNHKGLPPTPIDNPGLAAIRAAARPARTNYLYFVVKPCGNGSSVFSSTYQQFQADSLRYQTARAKRRGRSPAKC